MTRLMSEGFPNEGLSDGALPIPADRLLGVVLCGGESRRMGRDKGSMLKEGIPWARYIAGKLAPFRLPVVFSVNSQQRKTYPAFIPSGQLVMDNLSIAGPLKGLLSVHERFPSNDLLLLACDMLDLDEVTIRKMIAVYRDDISSPKEISSGAEYDFFVYQEGKFAQPFCGIYTCGALSAVYKRALQGGLSDFGLQSLLNEGKTKRIPIDRLEAFGNYNSL